MGIDTIKVIYTYSIATLLVLGGLVFLYLSRNDAPGSQSASIVPLVAGFVGAAVQFVFNRETQTSTARQVERAQIAATTQANIVSGASEEKP